MAIEARKAQRRDPRTASAHILWALAIAWAVPLASSAQQATPLSQPGVTAPAGGSSAADPQKDDTRIFGIVPNYRSAPDFQSSQPLTAKDKWKIGTQDAFDRGTFMLAAVFGGKSQLSNSNPSFGQGAKGFAHYFVTSYADFAIGDYMTEAIYPTVLHQDPRYFRHGPGSGWSRLGYAMGQIFWTHTDSRRGQFNYSEVVGNATAVAISNAYYPENRNASDAISKLGTQLGVDMAGNVMKEFWPDIRRKVFHKGSAGGH